MKNLLFIVACLSLFVNGCVSAKKVALSDLNAKGTELIRVNDPRWDGGKVPEGEQGKTCGGKDPHFPSLTFDLKGLATHFSSPIAKIEMYAYDVNWSRGHHGKWAYTFNPGQDTLITPKVPSETTVLPQGVKGLIKHTAKSCPTGYYLAPSSCRAGGGHKYFTDIILTLESGECMVTKFFQGVY